MPLLLNADITHSNTLYNKGLNTRTSRDNADKRKLLARETVKSISSRGVVRASYFGVYLNIFFIIGPMRGLGCGPAAASLLGLRVRIPPGSRMSLACECCVIRYRSLRRPDLSSRRVRTSVAGLKVIDEPRARGQGPLGLSSHDKNVFHYTMKFVSQIAFNSRLNKFLKVITEV